MHKCKCKCNYVYLIDVEQIKCVINRELTCENHAIKYFNKLTAYVHTCICTICTYIHTRAVSLTC